jgi:O-antigen/teichoic acid export membrane protein
VSKTMARLHARGPLTLSFSTSLAIQALNVLTGLLLARTLGPHGRGELAAVVLWPSVLVTAGSLGVTDAVTFHAAKATVPLGTLAGSALAIVAAQSALCVAAGLAIVPWVFQRYDAETQRAAFVFLAFVPLNLFALSAMALLNGLHRFGQYQALRLAAIAGTSGGIVALRGFDVLTVLNVTSVYVGAAAATAVLAAAVLPAAGMGRLRVSMPLARAMLGYGIKSHSGIVASLMNERLDQLLISVFLAPAQLGLYAMAVTLSSPANLAASSIASTALPVIARIEAPEARREAVRRFAVVTLASSTIVTLPVILFAPAIIHIFFKDPYLAATGVTRVLMVAAVALSLSRAMGACAKALGRPLDAGIAEFIGLGVTAAGLAVLLPPMGIMGAAIVSLVAYGLSAAWLLRRVARALEMPLAAVLLPDVSWLRRIATPGRRPLVVKAGE